VVVETAEPCYDVVVVGGGAAGLSAALMLARCLRRVVVVDAGRPRNAAAAQLHNFLTRDGTAPTAFLAAARAEVAGYGVTILPGTVHAADRTDTGFTVVVESGLVLHGRRLLVATGVTDELPALPGIHQRWGRDVLHCPYCHGYEVRGQPLGVLADSPLAAHSALQLRQWSSDVVLFLNTVPRRDIGAQERAALAARDVRIVDGEVSGLAVEDDRLTGVRLADGSVVARSALFLSSRPVPNDALLTALGAKTAENQVGRWVSTDPMGRTSVPGLWAVGNVTASFSQLVTFAADGTRAAMALNADLVTEDVAVAVARSSGQIAPAVGTG